MTFVGKAVLGLSTLLFGAGQAFAGGIGRAKPDQVLFQKAESPIAEEIHAFHNNLLLPVIIGICLFVLALIIYCVVRFNERANPTPSRTAHNTVIEVVWAVVPVMILVVIAIPSFRLLTYQLVIPPSDMTLKVTGEQWHWNYEYPKDQGGGFSFTSLMKPENEIDPAKGELRLLSVDHEAVVPVGKVVRVQITASDVIHSFVIQSLGVRMDAVPGRLNETWFKAEREGMYYGQCSKICGKDHAFMPIAFRVVSPERYAAWLEEEKKAASLGSGSMSVADNASPAASRQ